MTLSLFSSSRLKSVRFMDGDVVVMNLGKEFERIGAEAQHLPIATPLDTIWTTVWALMNFEGWVFIRLA